MSKISKKGNNSKIIKNIFSQNFMKYFSHHPISAGTSFKFLSLILFEIWHLQNFISIFSKGHNFLQGEIIQKKNARLLFFHEESIHEVSRRYLIQEYHSCKISESKILKAITQKISYDFFSPFFIKYSIHHPLSADTSFKFLAIILFEIRHLQNFIPLFVKWP